MNRFHRLDTFTFYIQRREGHKLILSLLKVVLTRTVLGSGNTGRYEGNTSRGFLLNLDFLLVPPMSDDHHDHHPDHDDDQAGRGDEHGQERL